MTRTIRCDALAGLRVRTLDGTLVVFVADDDGSTTGVREPRRPVPTPPKLPPVRPR